MRIYFDDVIYLLQKRGGISRYWNEVTYGLSKKEFNIIRDIRLFSLKSNLESRSLPLLKFIPVCVKNCDIFHSSYQRILLFKGSTKIVLTIHDCIYERYENGLRRKLHMLYTKLAINQADVIVTVSKSTEEDVKLFYPIANEKRLVVINNGINRQMALESYDNLPNNYLLYVGNRGYCKNFEFQLTLAAEFLLRNSDFHFVIVGGGDLSLSELELINLKGIRDRVVHLKNISDIQLNYIYSKAFSLLFCSLYEGFGIPIVEAFEMGCPVVCTNVSSIPEITGDNYPGLISIGDSDGALNFLHKCLDAEFRKKVVSSGKSRSKNFLWKRSHREHVKLYKSTL